MADPDWQRCSPEAFARQSPVNVRRQEVSEASVLNVFGLPSDGRIVGQHLVFEFGRPDEPAASWILDQRIFVCSPAKRVIVKVLFLVQQPSVVFEFSRQRLVGFLDPGSFHFCELVGELAVRSHRAKQVGGVTFNESLLFFHQHFVIDLTKRRRLVDDTAAGFGRDEVSRDHPPILLYFAACGQLSDGISGGIQVIRERRCVTLADQRIGGQRFDDG